MPGKLPPDIVLTEGPEGVHYQLPPPRLGLIRFLGVVPLLFGLAPIGMALFMAGVIIRDVLPRGGPPAAIFCACAGLMTIPFLAFGLVFVSLGLWLLAGHSEIVLTARELRAVLRVGPFRWSRRRPRSNVKQFTVVRGKRLPSQSAGFVLPGSFDSLRAECVERKPLQLAFGFPAAWLRPLADDLARRWLLVPGETEDVRDGSPIRVAEESDDPADIRERLEQPINSTAVLEREAGGVTVIIPPLGLWKGSGKFFLFWTLLCCGIVGLGTVIFVVVIGANALNQQGNLTDLVYPLLFLVPFWLIGIGCLLGLIHRGRRGTVLAVVGNRLMLLQTGLFGSRRAEWAREGLQGISVVPKVSRDSEGGEQWTVDLQIQPVDGPAVALLAYRPKPELEWIATVLRQALRMPGTPPAAPVAETVEAAAPEKDESPVLPRANRPALPVKRWVRRQLAGLITYAVVVAVVWYWNKSPAIATLTQMQNGTVQVVALSPDGKTLAAWALAYRPAKGEPPSPVKIWDVETQTIRATLTGHASEVYGAAFSPDGSLVATAGYDKTIRLWEAAKGQELAALAGEKWAFTSVAFSPDGKVLAGGHVGEVVLWEVASRRLLTKLPGPGRSVAFSPDGRWLAAGGGIDKRVRIWDAGTRKEIRDAGPFAETVWSIAFSPDNRTVAVAIGDGAKAGEALLVDAATGQTRFTLPASSGAVKGVAFSPDGRYAVTADGQLTQAWDTATGESKNSFEQSSKTVIFPFYRSYRSGTAECVAFSPDGRTVFAGGGCGREAVVKAFDVESRWGWPFASR